MPGMPVRVLRTPSSAARSDRSRHLRRRLAAVAVASVVASIAMATPGRAPVARADAPPPEYYANALSLTQNVSQISLINESGQMAGLTRNYRIARLDGQTVSIIDNGSGILIGMDANGTIIGQQNDHAVRIDGMVVTPLPSFGGYNEAPYAIDPTGTWIVGGSNFLDGEQISWVNVGGSSTPLPDLDGAHPNSYASKVTSSGQIFGTATTVDGMDSRFVTWIGGAIQDLGSFDADSGYIQDVNESGEILANVSRGGQNVPVLWDGTTVVDLPLLSDGYAYATDLNASGQVAYYSTDADGHGHALLWDNGVVTDLGMHGGTDAYVQGMNDLGQVTGGYNTADGVSHGFLYDHGVMYDINELLPPSSIQVTATGTITNSGYIAAYGAPNSGAVLLIPGQRPTARYDVIDIGAAGLGANSETYPTDMNTAHQVIGQQSTSHYGSAAFLYDGATASVLLPESSRGYFSDINENGVIFGRQLHDGHLEAFSYDGATHFLGTLGGDSSSSSRMGNVAGDVVGESADANGVDHAFLYHGGSMTPIPIVHGTTSEPVAINEAGLAIGYSYPGNFNGQEAYAFVSDGTTSTDLGNLGGTYTLPMAINEAGEIVGQSATATLPYVAFQYANGTMTDIGPPGSAGSWAVDINETGVILGIWRDASQNNQAYIYDHGVVHLDPGLGRGLQRLGRHERSRTGRRLRVDGHFHPRLALRRHGCRRPLERDPARLSVRHRGCPQDQQRRVDPCGRRRPPATLAGPSSSCRRPRCRHCPRCPSTPRAAHPTVATVTDPVSGGVTVTEAATNDAPPVGSGYSFLGHQLDIAAPSASTAAPISIVVKIDATLLASVDPDLTAADVAVFRNGTPVPPCTASTSDDPATPDPCVSQRQTLSGGTDAGDAQITVLTSAASHWNVGTIPTLPGAPTGATAIRGDKQATVSWTAPADTGHSPITGYTVTSTPGNKTTTVSGLASSAIVTGLTNGTSYTFTVKASNVAGPGAASAPSNAVIPGTLLAQTITFTKPANQVLSTPSITVAPTASSGLPVTLTSTSPTICTVSGFTISLLTVGTCAITANQAGGDGIYKAANPVSRTFTISQATQTITFAKPANQLLSTPTTHGRADLHWAAADRRRVDHAGRLHRRAGSTSASSALAPAR